MAWLYGGQIALLGAKTRAVLEANELRLSPMVALELAYLHEIDRVAAPAEVVLSELASQIGLIVSDGPFEAIIQRAMRQTWTRDPFDRLIVAHAALLDLPLVSKDEAIRAHYELALWPEDEARRH